MARFTTAPTRQAASTERAVRSVDRALSLLQLMGTNERSEWSLDELSRGSCLPKSTVHRLLETLSASGFVEHGVCAGYYRLGLQAAVIGSAALQLRRPAELVQKTVTSVRDRIGETASLIVLSGAHAIPVVRSFSRLPLRWEFAAIPSIFPAHACAGGKTLLAMLSEEEIHRLYAGQPRIRRMTPNTISSLPALLIHLRRIHSAGHAVDDEEFRVGLCGAAVPVPDGSERPRHALSISGPSDRLDRCRLAHALPVLRRAANDLSTCLAMEAFL